MFLYKPHFYSGENRQRFDYLSLSLLLPTGFYINCKLEEIKEFLVKNATIPVVLLNGIPIQDPFVIRNATIEVAHGRLTIKNGQITTQSNRTGNNLEIVITDGEIRSDELDKKIANLGWKVRIKRANVIVDANRDIHIENTNANSPIDVLLEVVARNSARTSSSPNPSNIWFKRFPVGKDVNNIYYDIKVVCHRSLENTLLNRSKGHRFPPSGMNVELTSQTHSGNFSSANETTSLARIIAKGRDTDIIEIR